MIRDFYGRLRRYGFRAAFWSLRFDLGYAVLPGDSKRVYVCDDYATRWQGDGGDSSDLAEFASAHLGTGQ